MAPSPPQKKHANKTRGAPKHLTATPNHDHSHDEYHHSLLERRLFASRSSKRVDLSISKNASAIQQAEPLTIFQLFPRQIIEHASVGHHLCELWLTNHRITVLPPEIAQLHHLRRLGLGGNALSMLPDTIVQLDALEALYLERNRIAAIPPTVLFPRHLRELRLDYNGLGVFPLQITQLRLLNCLSLSHNRITNVPAQIRRLRNLVQLDLDHNCIGPTLPEDEIICLQHLECIGLDGNALEGRSSAFSRMPALVHIRLNGNRRHVSRELEGDKSTGNDEEADRAQMRHDGYLQTTKGYHTHKPGNGASKSLSVMLDGVISCRDQNLVNAEQYRHQRLPNAHKPLSLR